MPHIIQEDEHSKYVKFDGQIFRHLFPRDYPPHTNVTKLEAGMPVICFRKVGTPLIVIHRYTGDGVRRCEAWFSHGFYSRFDDEYRSSEECYMPRKYQWPNSFNRKDRISA